MAGKFMQVKKLILPVMAFVILTSQLAGCATVSSNEMLDMLNKGQDIEISLAVPEYDIEQIGIREEYQAVQLDKLQTYTEGGFRDGFDKLFGITPVDFTNFSSKLGCIYVDELGQQNGNTALIDSLRNKVFMEKYFADKEVQSKLGTLAEKAYADVNAKDSDAVYAALNAYYNLFSDSWESEDSYFNGTQSVTRGEFYSFVYGAGNGVNNLLKMDSVFANQVQVKAQDKIALYASQVDEHAWLNADNLGLRPENYKSSISRAEAVYLLMNLYFQDELESIEVSSIHLEDARDGGDFLEDTDSDKKVSNALYSVDKKTDEQTLAKGWQLGALSKMLKDAEGNVQTDLYKALGLANQLGIIESETRYNEPVSKAEAIEMFIGTMEALNKQKGYLTEVEQGDTSMYIFQSDEEIEGTEGESNLDENGEVITPVEGVTHDAQGNPLIPEADPIPVPETKPEQGQSKPEQSKPESKPEQGGNQNQGQSKPEQNKPESKPEPPAPPVIDTPSGELGDESVTGDLDSWVDSQGGGWGISDDDIHQGFDPIQ